MLKHITTRALQSPLSTALRTRNFHSTTYKMVKQVQGLENFKKEIAFSGLTVVDFYAVWCGPCKMVAPVVERLSETVKEANFIKVDVDESPDVAAEYGVTAMPTFIFFKNGEKVETVIGANVGKLQASVKALA